MTDERDERNDEEVVSMGDDRCLVRGAGLGAVGRAGATSVESGRRAGGVYFLIVAIADAVDAEELSIGREGLSRLMGPGRFSVSQEEAERWMPWPDRVGML